MPGASWGLPGPPGAAQGLSGPPGAARPSRGPPGAFRRLAGPSEAARSAAGPPPGLPAPKFWDLRKILPCFFRPLIRVWRPLSVLLPELRAGVVGCHCGGVTHPRIGLQEAPRPDLGRRGLPHRASHAQISSIFVSSFSRTGCFETGRTKRRGEDPRRTPVPSWEGPFRYYGGPSATQKK